MDVTAKLLRSLVAEYPDLFDLKQTQNDSPALEYFLKHAEDEDLLMVYVVSDAREDKRVSVEGIIVHSEKTRELFGKYRPDENDKVGKNKYRLWWD